jgi:transcriptional regulator with XRE-family HTH domain
MDIDMKAVGQRVKERRKKLGLSQLDIYDKCGISSGTLSTIENGLRTPSVILFYLIAETLECDMEFLLTGKSFTERDTEVCYMSVSEDEKKLMEQFRTLSRYDREEILMLIQMKHDRRKK